MKKLFAILTIFGMFNFGALNTYAQEDESEMNATDTETVVDEDVASTDESTYVAQEDEEIVHQGLHKQLKVKYIEGGAIFMSIIFMCLVVGLSVCIERIIYLNLSTTNTKKLITDVESALETNGVEAAKEICRNSRGPVASIYYQGLDRIDEGLDVVEKSVTSYGSVQTGLLEKGLTWISLFITIAPMIGFMGTVLGMIMAFDNIQAVGDISATAVAGGMKFALITTVAGLTVAIILQLFYNYILSKIDTIVINMEDSSVTLMDILLRHSLKNK